MSEIKRMGYYAGAWKQSQATEYFPVTDSSTGEVIAEVPNCTAQECEEAIAAAQEAFPAWSRLSMAKRVQYLFKWREVLYAHKEELSILCAQELGKYTFGVYQGGLISPQIGAWATVACGVIGHLMTRSNSEEA